MKKIILTTALSIFITASVAQAVPTTWTDSIDWNPDTYVSWWATETFFLDLGNDGYVAGMEIDDYTLTVNLYDDGGRRDFGETGVITTLGGITSFSMGSNTQGWGFLGELDIEDDGTLNVAVTSFWGDFYLDSASLVANGDDGTAPVPEPTTMLLFGTGLLGLVGYSRKKRQK
jgi:hypothetical protein